MAFEGTVVGKFLRRERRNMAAALLLWSVLSVVALSTSQHADAQIATARLSGVVHDETGAVIPNADVTATQKDTGFTAHVSANANGQFNLPTLPVGAYTISITSQGFQKYEQTGLVLTVGQELSIEAGLKVGEASQTISVAADAVSIDATSPTQQSTVEEKVIRDLPLNGRNPATLTFTVAGVTDATQNDANSTTAQAKAAGATNPQESAPSIHGSRPGGTYFSLDGANNTDPYTVIGGPFPNPDAVGEFSVVTGTYGAQYVSAPGGAVNIITKSGTNQVHGSVFEFIRNGYFNARNALSTQPDVLKRNQFGVAIGAPIIRNRLFAFGTYQATPTRNSQTQTGLFPTAQQAQGNFGTFTIPSYLISPTNQKLLKYLPVSTSTSGFTSYQSPQNSNEQQGLIKLDLNLSKHSIFARGFYDRYTLAASGINGPAKLASAHTGVTTPWLSIALGDTWTSGSWIMQSRASLSRQLATSFVTNDHLSYNSLGASNLTDDDLNPAISSVGVYPGFQVGQGNNSQFPRKELEFSETIFSSHGKHQISFGANYRHVSYQVINEVENNPVAVYVGVNSYIYGLSGIIPGATLNGMADFILGAPYYFLQSDGNYMSAHGNLFGAFAEDNYKLTTRLTATVGLRWDPYFAFTPENGRAACYRPGQQSTVFTNAFKGQVFAGDANCPAAGTSSTLAEVQPRIGLAYQVDSQGKTALRAGYGRYDLQTQLAPYTSFGAPPFVRNYSLSQPFLSIDNLWASAGLSNPFVGGFQRQGFTPAKDVAFAPDQGIATISPDFHPGYMQQWSLSLQQVLTPTDSVDVAYTGTAGVHLPLVFDINAPVYSPGASTMNEQQRRPDQNFRGITQFSSVGTSSYNGVDVTYRHRTKSLSITSAFTWGKALDDNSFGPFIGSTTTPTTNHSFRRGRSDYDQNYVFRTTTVWTTPSLEKANRVTRSALGNWTLSGLGIIDAGLPFSVTDSLDNSYTGLNLDYADRVPNVPVYVNGKLNLAAFTDNAPGTFGNSGRNAYRGPSTKDLDVALMKGFPIHERLQGLFRAEAFNVFNHPNYYSPDNAYASTSTTFGQYKYARDQRIMQFSMKISF